ncbi:O-acetyl-ADP-ribose deacetylase MACROD2, partial [Microtus ochrogaster]
ERLLKMTLEERRKEYIRDYVPLSTIVSWKEEMRSKGQNDEENTQETPQMKKSFSEKVSLYRGDITLLEVDAIVNAGEWFTFLYFLCYVFMILNIFYTLWV